VLRRYGLTLDQVARAVRNASLDMPGGTIRTEGGEILIRTQGQAYWGQEFEDIVVLTRPDGTRVTAGRDRHHPRHLRGRRPARPLQRRPAVVVKVYQVGKENTIQMARGHTRLRARLPALLPPG
jgi:Cu/Ag efflux pump CusA